MGLDEELESMEEVGETDAEWTDQETELEDAEDDEFPRAPVMTVEDL